MKKAIYLLFFLPFVLSLIAPIQDGDPALYAEVSREIVINRDFLHLKANNEIFYEKPPLFFWFQSLFMKFTGINEVSARLPLFISLILTLFFIYRIAFLFYNKKTAINSLIITLTSSAFFVMVIQPKIDLLLICFLYGALWSVFEYRNSGRKFFLFLYLLFTSCGVLTKGPIGVLWPLFFLIIAYLFKFVNFKEIKIIIILSIFSVIPFLAWLKMVYNHIGKEGVFYLAIGQTFGRFVSGKFPKTGDPLYLFHSFLWAFLPWTIVFIYGIFKNLKNLCKKEIYFLSIPFLTLLISSFERWKMPQHSFPALIGAVIFTGFALNNEIPEIIFYITELILVLFVLFLTFFCFPNIISVLIFFVLLFIFTLSFRNKNSHIFLSVITSLTFVSMFFIFIEMVKYNAPIRMGKFLKDKDSKIYLFNTMKYYAIPFYSGKFVVYVNNMKEIAKIREHKAYLIINRRDKGKLIKLKKKFKIKEIKKFKHFYTSKPNIKFLLRNLRKNVIDTFYLYIIKNNLERKVGSGTLTTKEILV